MSGFFEIFIGLRYIKARRRNHFISFISLISMLGVGLGVMALIVVLSVMNGFEKELTERILGMASHATIEDLRGEFPNWRSIMEEVRHHPEITGVAPFHRAEGMLMNGNNVNGAVIRGVLPEFEADVSEVVDKITIGDFNALDSGKFNIVLGAELARMLGVGVGSKVVLVAPQANVTPAGIFPRLKRFNVVAIFEVGMHEFDSALALINLDDAKKLFRRDSPSALRLKTVEMLRAPQISREIAARLPGDYWVVDWTQRNANFFRALKTEKTVMFVILTLIVAVAAFNIISTLVMVVADKQSDIAVLRTLGASPKSILTIFIIHGTIIGLAGIIVGVGLGVVIALNVEAIVPAIEQLFDTRFLSPDIYYISELPSDLHWDDVTAIAIISFALCILATIYPALRASGVRPAEALRYE